MKDRIIRIIEEEKLTPAEFADIIGIQRSSLSHVMNGRNNPSFLFIQKILENYPKINSRWLITGEGSVYNSLGGNGNNENRSQQVSEVKSQPIQANLFSEPSKKTELIEASPVQNEVASRKQETKPEGYIMDENIKHPQKSGKIIEKVLIFYTDSTFDFYSPSK